MPPRHYTLGRNALETLGTEPFGYTTPNIASQGGTDDKIDLDITLTYLVITIIERFFSQILV